MAQWWERSPLTNVVRVQIPASTPYVGWVCSWFAPRGFSPDTPVFPSPQRPTFPDSNSAMSQVDEEPLCGCATSKSSFIYLFYSNSANWANHVLSQSTALLFLLFFSIFYHFFSICLFLFLLFLFFLFFSIYLKQMTNLHYDKDYRWQLTCWTVFLTFKGKGKWNINDTEMTILANVDLADWWPTVWSSLTSEFVS